MSFKVIKSGTNRKLVYDILLVLCSNFWHTTQRVYEKFSVKHSNDLEISPRSAAVYVSVESSRVISYK